jgi:hypothetical protein
MSDTDLMFMVINLKHLLNMAEAELVEGTGLEAFKEKFRRFHEFVNRDARILSKRK